MPLQTSPGGSAARRLLEILSQDLKDYSKARRARQIGFPLSRAAAPPGSEMVFLGAAAPLGAPGERRETAV